MDAVPDLVISTADMDHVDVSRLNPWRLHSIDRLQRCNRWSTPPIGG